MYHRLGQTVASVGALALGGCWLDTPAPASVAHPKPVEQQPLPAFAGLTTLSPEIVLAKIHDAYMGGVKRCYTVLLKNRPNARGKVMITFTVDGSGVAQHGEAHGFADTVDACITSLIGSWKFPEPKDHDGASTEATFRLPLDLTTD